MIYKTNCRHAQAAKPPTKAGRAEPSSQKSRGRSPLVALRRARNPLLRPQAHSLRNGAGGEKRDSVSRRGEHDRPSFVRYAARLPLKTVRWTVFNEQYFVWVSKHNYKFVPSQTSHCDVWEIYFVAYRKKGERSCPLPLGMTVVIPHPFHRFGRKGFRRLRAATKGLRPLDFCELGSARPALVGGFAA